LHLSFEFETWNDSVYAIRNCYPNETNPNLIQASKLYVELEVPNNKTKHTVFEDGSYNGEQLLSSFKKLEYAQKQFMQWGNNFWAQLASSKHSKMVHVMRNHFCTIFEELSCSASCFVDPSIPHFKHDYFNLSIYWLKISKCVCVICNLGGWTTNLEVVRIYVQNPWLECSIYNPTSLIWHIWEMRKPLYYRGFTNSKNMTNCMSLSY
jgi:hypothetical protein